MVSAIRVLRLYRPVDGVGLWSRDKVLLGLEMVDENLSQVDVRLSASDVAG